MIRILRFKVGGESYFHDKKLVNTSVRENGINSLTLKISLHNVLFAEIASQDSE